MKFFLSERADGYEGLEDEDLGFREWNFFFFFLEQTVLFTMYIKDFKKKIVTVNVPTNEQKFEKRNELRRGENETIEAADCY